MAQIKYPTWKVRGNPTPNELLLVCDTCGKAQWATRRPNWQSAPHRCSDGKNRRYREATKAEYAAGKAALEEII